MSLSSPTCCSKALVAHIEKGATPAPLFNHFQAASALGSFQWFRG